VLELSRIESDRDWDDWVSVRTAVLPRRPLTADELRFFARIEPDHLHLLARLDGRPAGGGFAGPLLDIETSDHGELWVAVTPERRQQGIGTAVLERLQAHLRGLGKSGGHVTTDSEEGLAYALRRGYREVGREQTVSLDLERWQPSGRPPPEGIEITDLEQRPDLLRAVWEIDTETARDIPAEEHGEGVTWEWYRTLVDKPGVDLALVVVALAGDEAVGCAWLTPRHARPDLAMHWMAGVRRPWRGRGIAGALKEAQLLRARERGVRIATTNNELRNEPIRRLNARLGYQPEPDRITLRGPLT
jgi:GNAT superfamily N-acetyltransferase